MKTLLMIGLLSLCSALAQAEIGIQVDSSQVILGNPFKLTITQDDPQQGGLPDLSTLQHDFVILGTERSLSYSIINGQTQSSSQWIVTLNAKKPGLLTIPAIRIGVDRSTPMTINVQEPTETSKGQADTEQPQAVSMLSTLSEKKPYVNQQIIYTVKLYNSKRLLNAQYQGPQIEDALLIPLGDTNRYQAVQNNIPYVVEEQNYAIYPQKSGTLKITSPTFTALIYDPDPQRIRIQDKPIKLKVQAIPKQYKGATWLPAKLIKLTERYEGNNQSLDQGSTLTRIVTIEGVGLPGQLLPTLSFKESNKYKVYTETAQEHNQIKQGDLVGSTETKVTYLFNQAGKITIPKLTVSWFNTATQKEEVAVLPPRSIAVTATTTATKEPVNQGKSPTQLPKDLGTIDIQRSALALIATLLFALGSLLTWGFLAWEKQPKTALKQGKETLTALEKACTQGNPSKARNALIQWAILQYPDATLLNLNDVSQVVGDPQLKKQIQLLSEALYQRKTKTAWQGNELLKRIHSIKRTKLKVPRKRNILPPINP